MTVHRNVLLLSLLLACPAVATSAPAATIEPHLNGATAQHVYRSATQGRDPAAMYALGNMFEQGIGAARDYEEAFRWYYQAAELGNGEAMNCLGIAYATGQGAPRNDALSLRWFLKAAEKGSVLAMSNIAKMYYLGAGVPVDVSKPDGVPS
jgi:TPR repeat protein